MTDQLPPTPEEPGSDERSWTLGGILRLALAEGTHENWARNPTPSANGSPAFANHQDCRDAGATCSKYIICHNGGDNGLPLCGFRAAHLAQQTPPEVSTARAPLPGESSGVPVPAPALSSRLTPLQLLPGPSLDDGTDLAA